MSAFWLVAIYEYKRNVLRKGFLIALVSVPLWLLVAMGIGWIMVSIENDATPIGYVDHSGVLQRHIPAPPPEDSAYKAVPIREYPDESAARAALDAEEIRGYYVLPADYLSGGAVTVVYRERIREAAQRQFEAFVRVNLAGAYPPAVARRLLEGTQWEVIMLEGSSVNKLAEKMMRTLVPFISGTVLYIGLFIISGYLMHAVLDEKENRTIEILATSIRPETLMAGKIVGIFGVGMTQVVAWLGMGLVAFLFFRLNLPDIPPLEVDWGLMARILAVLIPAFAMVSGLMAAIGAMLSDASEGQQLTGLVTLPLMLPLMLLGMLIPNPDSPLSVVMSIFPLTAPMTMLLRLSLGQVAMWQFLLSVGLLALCAVGSLWLAGKVLRLGMLQYGRRLRVKEIWQNLAGRA